MLCGWSGSATGAVGTVLHQTLSGRGLRGRRLRSDRRTGLGVIRLSLSAVVGVARDDDRGRPGEGVFGVDVGRRLLELRLVQPPVGALSRDELVVRALLHDVTVLHHEDEIGVADGRKAVRDHERRASLSESGHRVLQQQLGAGVDS